MRAPVLLTAALVAFTSSPALAEDEAPPASWDEYQGAHSLSCKGSGEPLAKPETRQHAGFEYTFHGTWAKVRRLGEPRKSEEIKLGVLSGIKELDPPTRAALDGFFARFKAEGVEAILVGGDSAERESHLEEVFAYLAACELPVFVVIGNWESRAPFNRALRLVAREHPNVVNMSFARRIDADGYDVVGLGGYTERAYAKSGGVCLYKKEDVDELVALAGQADDPVVLLMHGPPLQKGQRAIDFVPGAGNVGDPSITEAIKRAKIAFGVHGHILEAGGRATDLAGKPLAEGKLHPALFLNPGPASALPWKLNDGKMSYGLAAILTLKGKSARYEILRASKPRE
ncbi:MAG: metallophosphoesterase family protein [Myxococcales bacterium]